MATPTPTAPGPNRAAKRQRDRSKVTDARRNGTAHTPAPYLDPTIPIFSHAHTPVTFGTGKHAKTFHIARLTTYGVKAAQEYMEKHYPPRLLASGYAGAGAGLVNGAMVRKDFGPLFGFMEYMIAESDLNAGADDPKLRGRFVVRDLWLAEGEQLIDAIDQFMAQAGLEYLERMVKDSAASVQVHLEEAIRRAGPEIAQMFMLEAAEEAERARKAATQAEAMNPDSPTHGADQAPPNSNTDAPAPPPIISETS